ncbi:N5-carboxyaminoimidazole ribonucleotide synthase [Candidatus Roizmanbacteria bacterium]|nr:N5-carboxyaminoimidazole ribonucleotide synthase [Candidatus Roizmanbacteria bacterium]
MKNRIGIIGGGQLGRMLTIAANKLGFVVNVLDPTPNSPAGQVAQKQIIGNFNNRESIKKLAKISDFLTFEIELADDLILDEISKTGVIVNPTGETLSIIKDKLKQKTFLKKYGLPVADFLSVRNKEDIIKVAKEFGYPILLKARFDAYDGRGNALVKNEKEIDQALKKLEGRLLYVEKFVPFIKELAVVTARNIKGEVSTYPVVETIHKNNICHIVKAPAQVEKTVQEKAKKIATEVLKKLGGAGVFAIEMFLTKNDEIIINEIAPRVHNSGHHTIESSITSQFEQHIRAITGMPLGKTDLITPGAVMINILGERKGKVKVTGLEKLKDLPNTFIHIYGKSEVRPERKMGHITVTGDDLDELLPIAIKARKYIKI